MGDTPTKVIELPNDATPDEVEAVKDLITIAPQADHHVITGMAALARMSAEDYEATIGTMLAGMERVRDFQKRAMVEGEDYGKVKGIERPFLHLPGAEKLCLLYGLAVRQEAERVTGDWMISENDGSTIWTSPPLAYHVKSYVHLGSFDGPVVGMGYGEANSWETKYRYTWAKAKCPACGREGLIRGKKESRLQGKWWCPGAEGGCNRTFEPNDPNINTGGKVDNPDPYSQAETLIQMAAKRSFVAATRRATGTSGLFTQDEDAPTVQRQSDAAPPEGEADPVIENIEGQTVEKGGKPNSPTPAQIAHLSKISKEKDLGPDAIAATIDRLFGNTVILEPDATRGAKGQALLAYLKANLTADQMGTLLQTLDTGEVPVDAAAAAEAPTKATN